MQFLGKIMFLLAMWRKTRLIVCPRRRQGLADSLPSKLDKISRNFTNISIVKLVFYGIFKNLMEIFRKPVQNHGHAKNIEVLASMGCAFLDPSSFCDFPYILYFAPQFLLKMPGVATGPL